MTQQFDAHADSYREQVNHAIGFAGKNVDFYARRKAEILGEVAHEHIGPAAGLAILDVGCGIGLVDGYLTETFAEVAGVDVSEEEVARAREEHPGVTYAVSDPTRIPHEDGCFDIVFAAAVLHHVSQEAQLSLVAEMARVVRSGGVVVVFEHNPLNPLTRVVVSRIPFDEGVVLLRSREVAGLFAAVGLGHASVRNMTFLPFGGRFARFVERHLAGVPFGAQYAVVAPRA